MCPPKETKKLFIAGPSKRMLCLGGEEVFHMAGRVEKGSHYLGEGLVRLSGVECKNRIAFGTQVGDFFRCMLIMYGVY